MDFCLRGYGFIVRIDFSFAGITLQADSCGSYFPAAAAAFFIVVVSSNLVWF
ncbi:hypothetical protein [Propionispira arboris]|uniref:hypothetical protein n=1 Tax=Propionispira arboris TaxID=84035 RepID=UPI0015A65CB7|nr:hypothetical protein [Propionispira arboris]